MVCLVVAAYGRLAEGFVASLSMIVGPSGDVVAITFDPSEGPDDLLARYTAVVEASSSQEYLIPIDPFSGNPYNVATRFVARRDDADIVTGVNLPVVTEVLSRRLTDADLAELVEAVHTSAVDGVRVFSEVFTPASTITPDGKGDEL